MAFELLEANTHSDVAKDQHLVPRTYMREWSPKCNDSILVFNKEEIEKEIQPQNVDKINYKTGFHDIKAGAISVPDEAKAEAIVEITDHMVSLFGMWNYGKAYHIYGLPGIEKMQRNAFS